MIKKIFSVSPGSNRDAILLMVRVAIAALMLVHGLPKLGMLMGAGPVQFVDILGGPRIALTLAVFAEVVCSVLILIGLGTRAAAVPLIVTMLVAVFYVHGGDPFIKQEMGLHYLLVYSLLLLAGSGKYSADYLVAKNIIATRQPTDQS